MSYSIKAGNLGLPIRVRLTEDDGTALDLSVSGPGYALAGRLRRPDGTVVSLAVTAVAEGGGTVVGSNGWAEHIWTGTGDSVTDQVGQYRFEVDATLSSKDRTFPGTAWVEFTVEPVLAAEEPTAIVWGEVVSVYADAVNVSGLVQGMILDWVNGEIDPSKFRTTGRCRMAKAFYAAHMAVFAQPSETGTVFGPVKRDKVGDVETEYIGFSVESAARSLERTSYGQLYLDAIRTPYNRGPFLIG